MDRQTDRQTDHQNEWCQQIPLPSKHSPRHQNHHPMFFRSKVMSQNVLLHNGGEHNAAVFGQHTDCKELWDWSRPKLAHVKIRAHSCYW